MRAGKTDRQVADALYRTSFAAFAYRAYAELYGNDLLPNWHIGAICHRFQQMMMGRSENRLVLNAPPRSLKSFISSIALVAWILGRDPAARIICASYSENLAFKFSRDCRALIETPFYRRVFPRTMLNRKKATEAEVETTRGGYRLATSVGGTLTRRGCALLIIDDPIKANDAYSQVALTGANDWFRNTVLSRLDEPGKSRVVITMQRLHAEDLSGTLIQAGWPYLVLPQIAREAADYDTGEDQPYHRPAGETLQPNRDSLASFDELKAQVGSAVWAAQYQQDPTPPDGNMINRKWLGRYQGPFDVTRFSRRIIACDPAAKNGIRNDYTAVVLIRPHQQHVPCPLGRTRSLGHVGNPAMYRGALGGHEGGYRPH
jgi:hypothetical protein